jgi:23S rRNA (cytidine1920-2'-O)/16S rRNA (cytidine1409-2'-O)-methyltransferase
MKKRLDQYLADGGFFESRARARAAVMEGLVEVDGKRDVKPGTQVSGEESIHVIGGEDPFVSRGGLKLAGALEAFGLDPRGLVVLDVGASTGGFTDCLLRAGAARVMALDVGKGQLHWKLRGDDRVTVLEGRNARELRPQDLPERADLAVIDVSFISLTMVLGPVMRALREGGEALALVKPQFEAGRASVGKGGVVRDPAVHLQVLERLAGWMAGEGMVPLDVAASDLKGPKGNIEFFFRVGRSGKSIDRSELEREVRRAHGQGLR